MLYQGPKYSATQERSIGIGALGYHAYLQKQMLPWESAEARSANVEIFRHIRKSLDEANLELGKLRGEISDAWYWIKGFLTYGY